MNLLNVIHDEKEKKENPKIEIFKDEIPDPVEIPAEYVYDPKSKGITFPPGLIGEVAEYAYKSASRPVPEVAIVSALSLFAGVNGRCYNVSNTGLNIYQVLLADTGSGKDGLAKAMEKLVDKVVEREGLKELRNFLGPKAVASEAGLRSWLANRSPSIISVFGEIGMFLGSATGAKADTHRSGVINVITQLYSLSGNGQTLGASAYADQKNVIENIYSPSFSITGESNPGTFYEYMTPELVSLGFMPRWIIFEYKGERPKFNYHHEYYKTPQKLIDEVGKMMKVSKYYNDRNQVVNVGYEKEAYRILKEFNESCDAKMISAKKAGGVNRVFIELWNRAHLNVLKLSALVATGMPFHDGKPLITKEAAEWAIKVVVSNVVTISNKFKDGEAGVSEFSADEGIQNKQAVEAVKFFLQSEYDKLVSYGVSSKAYGMHVIPYSFFYKKLAQIASFRKDVRGSKIAVQRALDNMVDSGDLRLMTKEEVAENFEKSGKFYKVSDVTAFMD